MSGVIKFWAPDNLEPAHPGDAGLDLRASEQVLIGPGAHTFVHTGVRIALPLNTFAWVVARSSTFGQYNLLVLPGIIDAEYTGEIGVSVFNPTTWAVRIRSGERVAQLLLLKNGWTDYVLEPVGSPEEVHPVETTRGANGFGSTGR